ncbi:MAG: hypothetical protein ACREBU_02880 [Nitrososphaera sp.]
MANASWIFIALLVAIAGSTSVAYAQDGGMRATTSKGSLDILLEPEWNESGTVKFRTSFLNPGTNEFHQHQDYDFKILQGGNEIFSAAKQINQPLIHNFEGKITVPYTFEQNGDYVVEVDVLGLGSGPTLIPTDESVQFNIKVTPEFPAGMTAAVAGLVASAIILTRKLRRF